MYGMTVIDQEEAMAGYHFLTFVITAVLISAVAPVRADSISLSEPLQMPVGEDQGKAPVDAEKLFAVSPSLSMGQQDRPMVEAFNSTSSGAPLANISTIVAGGGHTCALLTNGIVRCWGRNNFGQPGITTPDGYSRAPITVSLPLSATAISAGREHTCALLTNGTIRCWGSSERGQLGNGTSGTGSFSSAPVAVSLPLSVTAISAGGQHTCALLSDGTIRCWGDNTYGQVGNGTLTPVISVPVTVNLPSGATATAIAVGGLHTCALLNDGTARCWGRNDYGQIGNGNTGFAITTPVTVSLPLSTANALSAGREHTCAILNNGTARCWGRNHRGQIGNGTIDYFGQLTPVTVSLPSGATVAAISAGGDHTCAVLNGGTARCWGDGFRGQLGNGTVGWGNYSSSPITVSLSSGATVVAVSAGGQHTCAVLNDGTARCWGDNYYGQLGNGLGGYSSTPVSVIGLSNLTAIAAGDLHTCAMLSDGTVRCWGDNEYGELGNGSSGLFSGSPGFSASSTPVAVIGLSNTVAIAAGERHTCAVLSNGTARCWGWNSDGQIGNGTAGPYSVVTTPVTVSTLSNATTVAAGWRHTCAALNDGTVRCWGNNWSGQLGDGTTMARYTPVAVSGLSAVTAIAAGWEHTCALLNDGTVRCWGNNISGQLGNGTWGSGNSISVPVTVSLPLSATAIATGANHTCASLIDGTVRCWGNNLDGQIGRGTWGGVVTVPVTVSLPLGAVAVTAGRSHTCAALSNGTARCWGRNVHGQLGNGTLTGSNSPVAVSMLNNAIAIVAGWDHTCALLSNGIAHCWGYNQYGQLGHGVMSYASVPNMVILSDSSLPLLSFFPVVRRP
jgi:alpha-tubulin suppressor-like RCC1 family protein